MDSHSNVAVIIPCYKVRSHILDVLKNIGSEVNAIYVVDDCCPEGSGDWVESQCHDKRVKVLHNPTNLGVGGAVMAGYAVALADGADILVKIDGDGQMDPRLISDFIAPILADEADYTKGNRFFDLEEINAMPKIRLFGNAVLSFMTKLSSGYWDIFDPTNGYTALHRTVAAYLPFRKISQRYFFETDMLFRLNTLRAVVVDIPMSAKYGNEVSSLKIFNVVGEFFVKHVRNFMKRIFYNYFLRDMSLGSIQLPLGLTMFIFGCIYGGYHWWLSIATGAVSTAGTVMLSALTVIVGLQFMLAFLAQDISAVPRRPFHRLKRKTEN
ncbi:MAG: glycosyltransferase family 2 protein [Gammaproteobacteria bacterium]